MRGVALGLVVVALVPRTSGAQATVSATHSTRHTVRAAVGTVTHAAFLSQQRLTAEQAGLVPSSGNVLRAERAWISTVEVRSNVNGVLMLEPRTVAPGGAPWRVMTADGQLVPWTSQAISISPILSAGRHTVSFIWVAPDDTTAPPVAPLRVQLSP